MSAYKLANDFEISLQEAQDFIDAFYDSYPKLKPYFERRQREALDKGLIVIDQFTGRISHNDSLQRIYEDAKAVIQVYNSSNQKPPGRVLSDYYMAKSQIGRNAQNYPIQGSAASMTKMAIVMFMNVIRQKEL